MRKPPRRKPTENQVKIAAYIAVNRHLGPRDCAKSIREMADEIGIRPDTLRSELRQNYHELWAEHWAPYHVRFADEFAAIEARRSSAGPNLVDTLPIPGRDEIADEDEEMARYC